MFCRIVVATMAVLRNMRALCMCGQGPVNIHWTDGEQRKYSSHASAMYRFYCDNIYMGVFKIFARFRTLKFTMMNKRETEPPYIRGTHRQIERTINHLQPTG